MFLLFGWLVCPGFMCQREGGSGRFICQKNCPGLGMILAGVISGSGHIQGAEDTHENSNTCDFDEI